MHPLVSTKPRHLRHLLRVSLGLDELGRRIKQAREDAHLTQQELADRIGIKTAQSISRYERGETEVSTKRLRRIAEATGKEMTFFVTLPAEVSVQDDRLIEMIERAVERVLVEKQFPRLEALAAAVDRLEQSGRRPPQRRRRAG
jgi:transcriptional regulator with XRE-family HTH domain